MTTKAQSARLLLFGLSFVLCADAGAQASQPDSTRRLVVPKRAVINFTKLAQEKALAPATPPRQQAVPFMPRPPRPAVPPEAAAKVSAAQAQPFALPVPGAPSPVPDTSFEALGDNNTRIPPDTQGAVGPNHLMVTLNTEVRIQNRTGVELSIMSLNDFWSSTAASSPFDPKVVYDPFAQRWIFVAVSNARSSDSSLLVGVTQTNDPTGGWNLYRVDADAADTAWADYPSLGFNKDWIGITVNMFAVVGNSYVEELIFVFDKADLYAGTSADLTVFVDANAFTQVPALTFDNSLGTLYLVEDWNGNSSGSGFLRLSTITGAVGAESYTAAVTFISTPNTWDPAPPGGADFAPQQGTTNKIQNNDSRLLTLVYRNGSLWAAQNAFLPAGGSPTRTAAQWWQFTVGGTVQQFGRVDDPTGAVFYAFPSLAVNSNADVLMGFSSFSASQFASASYAFRAVGDPPNTMRTPTQFKSGEATYFKMFSGNLNRWGDYSSTVVDPVNDVDFWTIQEYASSPPFPTGHDRWGTWWAKVVPPPATTTKKRRGQTISQ